MLKSTYRENSSLFSFLSGTGITTLIKMSEGNSVKVGTTVYIKVGATFQKQCK